MNSMSLRATLLVALTLASACSSTLPSNNNLDPGQDLAPQPPPPPISLPELRKRISFDHRGNLPELIDQLHALSGANLLISPRLLKELRESGLLDRDESKHSLSLRDVPAESALRWILDLSPGVVLDYRVQDNTVLIDLPARLHAHTRRLHDLQGIRNFRGDRPGGQLSIGSEDATGLLFIAANEPGDSELARQMIIDLIKENAAPGTWEGVQTIERVDESHLLVNAPPAVHDEVAWLLDALRSCCPATVSVSCDLVDADPHTLPLLAPGAPLLLSPAEADAAALRFRAAQAGRHSVTGLDDTRSHSLQHQSTSGLLAWQADGKPLLGTWISDATILDVRPGLAAGGRALNVELRLAIGQTRDLPAIPTPSGPLPRRERTVTHLGTTLSVPNGGAALFALPSRDGDASRPRLCLLRARSEDAAARLKNTYFRRSPAPPQRELFDKLENGPAADGDFKNAPLSEVVAWLRKSSGLNWILAPGLEDTPVTLRCAGVSVAKILPFLLAPLELDVAARHDALFIAPRATFHRQNETCIIGTRDALGLGGPADFPGSVDRPDGESKVAYTGEDLANIIKNTIHKDRWEEAEGHSIQYMEGVLLIRNAPDVIRDCLAFVELQKNRRRRSLALRADLLTVPAAAVGDPAFLDAAAAEALRAAAGPGREQLAWQAQDGQRSSVAWDRARDYLFDVEEKGATAHSMITTSMVELAAFTERTGGGVAIDLRVKDQWICEILQAPGKAAGIELPALAVLELTTSFSLPAGKTAVFHWALPEKAGEERRVRVLLIQATPLPREN